MPHEQEELFFGLGEGGGAHGWAGKIERTKAPPFDIKGNSNIRFETKGGVTGMGVVNRFPHMLNRHQVIGLVGNFADGLLEGEVLARLEQALGRIGVQNEVIFLFDAADNAEGQPE